MKAATHESFERSSKDLLTHVTITLSEALLGFSRILITHLDGRGVRVTSPPGKILKTGDTIVLRGEGMPTYKQPDQKGDLYIILDIEMPDSNWLNSVDRDVCSSHSQSCRFRDLYNTILLPRPLRPFCLPRR